MMQPHRWRVPAGLAALAAVLWCALPRAPRSARAEDPAAGAEARARITLLYTVNNLGYTDTCG